SVDGEWCLFFLWVVCLRRCQFFYYTTLLRSYVMQNICLVGFAIKLQQEQSSFIKHRDFITQIKIFPEITSTT
ncbi:hypothetical protein, partial [Bradyrhizobium canariense]|uniref:hypothetical protein n=1 Tax=Bradyrhizobium canariense TaxID=255045 RepID=UPI001A7E0DC5